MRCVPLANCDCVYAGHKGAAKTPGRSPVSLSLPPERLTPPFVPVSPLLYSAGKDAKEALYRMLADGVLSQQEVPKRPDHHPQFTFFLFRAELHKLLTLMTERSHHALLNVRRRRRMETGRLAEATAIATATAGAAAVAGAAPITVSLGAASSGGMTKARARMLNAPRVMSAGVDRLLLSEARLDATLLLARDMHWLNWKAAR